MTEVENISPSSSMTSSKSYRSSSSSGCNQSMPDHKNSIQGLPKQFVKSMRTLFDMLDDSNTGAVPLAEIERRWRDDAVPNLPGVLSALKDIAPPEQLLTFDTFVCGLRLALSRARKNEVLPLKSLNAARPKWNGHGKLQSLPCDHPLPNQKYSNVAAVFPSLHHQSNQQFQTKLNNTVNLKRRDTTVSTSKSNRPFRHRRSNSGPIFTAKIIPNVKHHTTSSQYTTQDDIKVDNGGQNHSSKQCNAKQNAEEIRKLNFEKENNCYSKDKENRADNYYRDSSNCRNNTPRSNLDQITASTLFINEVDGASVMNMQPVVLSGKYIGITGTLKRTKSSVSIPQHQQYGSLQRSSKNSENKPMVISASMNSFSTMGRSAASSRFSRNAHSLYTATGKLHSGDQLDRKRAIESNSGKVGEDEITQINENRPNNEGHGRRCNSSSPPEIPIVKYARSSSRAEVTEIPKLNLHGSMSSSTSNGDSSAATSPRSIENVAKALFTSPSDSRSSQNQEQSTPPFTVSTSAASGIRRRANSASIQQRRNIRRHTVATGIDYNTIKYMKQLDDQKKLLLQGLQAIDSTKSWFERRLNNINERQNQINLKINKGSLSVGRSTSSEDICKTEPGSADYRLDNIAETEKQMRSLMNTVSQLQTLFTSTATIEVNNGKSEEQSLTITTLRDHNQLLTREVSDKSDQVVQLQKEKAALVRQLFQARAELQQNSGNQVNTSIFI
ncbi:uncharacterized protein LOC120346977 isoform X1 [Styela clava]